MNSKNRGIVRPPLIISQIGRLHKTMFKECDKRFRQMGFPVEMDQIPVFAALYYEDGLSQQEICSKLQRDKASVNRTISFLSKRGFARVVQDVTDRRKTRIELTAIGKKLALQVDAVIKEIETSLISALTEKEVQQFSTLINKLIETSFT
jgi:DNA-binding MarR family transcriptional regulator